jgi:hypothetical protein
MFNAWMAFWRFWFRMSLWVCGGGIVIAVVVGLIRRTTGH